MVVTVLHVVAGVVILAAVAFAIRVRSSSRAVVRNMQAVLKEADSVNMESKRLVKHSESIRDCLETLLRESNSAKAFEEVSARCCRTLGLDAMHVVDFSDPSTMEDRLSDIYAVARRGETVLANSDDIGVVASSETVAALRNHFRGDTVFTIVVLPFQVNGSVWGCMIGKAKAPVRFDAAMRDFTNLFVHSIESYLVVKLARENLERNRARLASALDEVERASHAKTRFLATMSHEIRTPLNAVVGYSEILSRPALKDEELKECADGINRSSQALLSLINDVLDIVKLESSKLDMREGSCDLGKLFAELDTVFRYKTAQSGVVLKSELPPEMPVLKFTESRMRQILFNLVGNAVKFTSKGSVAYIAKVTPDGNGTVRLDLEVSDTGIGISAEAQKTIFDPFAQDISTRGGKVYEGTGLGLAIVKRLVEAAGGTVRLVSAPGVGTSFVMRFDGVATLGKTGSDKATATGGLDLPPGLKVVMVDDVPLNLRILTLHVKNLGVGEIVTFGSPVEALAHIREKGAGIVLTDMWMPDMSGADFAKAIRDDERLRSIPVVAVTADADSGASFDTSVFDRVITKPVTAAKVREVFSAAFGGGKGARA